MSRREDLAALNGVVQGVVTIGALPLARSQILPSAIASACIKHPQLRIRSLESPYEELMAGLLSGRIDFIVGALRKNGEQGFESRSLMEDKAVLIARCGHPLVKKDSVSLRDIEQFPWVLSRAGTPLRVLLEQFFDQHGIRRPEPVAETGDLALLRGLLANSDMLTVLSAHQLHYEIETDQLVVLPFNTSGMERMIGITTRKGAHLSPGARVMLNEIDSICERWR